MMEAIVHWVREDPSELGRPQLAGALPHDSMAIPMMLLNLVDQLSEGDGETASRFKELDNWSVQRILSHLQVKEWVWPASPLHKPLCLTSDTLPAISFSCRGMVLQFWRMFLKMARNCQGVWEDSRILVKSDSEARMLLHFLI